MRARLRHIGGRVSLVDSAREENKARAVVEIFLNRGRYPLWAYTRTARAGRPLRHAITIFEILHPGCRGVWLFDNSTGHGKMPEEALLAQNTNTNPGGKHVSKQREATWFGSRRQPHLQSFVFKEGDRLLFDVKIRAAPLTEEGDVYFPEGTVVEVQRAETKAWTKGAHIAARDGDTYTAQIDEDGAAAPEELKGVAVSRIRAPTRCTRPAPSAPPAPASSGTRRASSRPSSSASFSIQ